MKANIKLELKTLTPTKLAVLMGVVESHMAGNALFPHPPVPMAALAAKKDVLWEAITNAIKGSQQDRLVRDGHVAEAKAMLRHLADYVRMVAQGDPVVLGASGFAPATVPQPIGVVGAPMIHEVRMTGRHGEVLLRWSGIHGRRAYHIYVTDQDPASQEATWHLTGATGKIMHRVTGLEPWKAYWFCVCALGPLGEGRKSDPAPGRAA